jgi:hypothetical protein
MNGFSNNTTNSMMQIEIILIAQTQKRVNCVAGTDAAGKSKLKFNRLKWLNQYKYSGIKTDPGFFA